MTQERRPRSPRNRRKRATPQQAPFLGLPYHRSQYLLMALGILFIGVGFVLLYLGDAVISTLALVLGYVVLIPVALWPWKSRRKHEGVPS